MNEGAPATLLVGVGLAPDAQRAAAAARERGWQTVPLDHRALPTTFAFPPGRLAYMGDTVTGYHLAASGLSLLEPTLDLLTRFPRRHLSRRVAATTLAEAARARVPTFVKPAGRKRFRARVWPPGLLAEATAELPPDTLVLTSEPVVWSVEYRVFVADREIVEVSLYDTRLIGRPPGAPCWSRPEPELRAILTGTEAFLADESVELPPACSLDVGLLEDGTWAVVELNHAWASRQFGCRPERLLPALALTCHRAGEVPPEHARWICDDSLLL